MIRRVYTRLPRPLQRTARTAHAYSRLFARWRRLRGENERLQKRLDWLVERIHAVEHEHDPNRLIGLDYDKAKIKLRSGAHRRRKAQTKEPFTVAWIEEHLPADGVLFDVGANIGAYSLVAAAAHPGARVVAVEPGFASFALLCEHIVLNGFADRITPLPIALGETTGLRRFGYSDLAPGAARHTFEESEPLVAVPSVYEQPMLSFRLDDLIAQFGLPAPNLIKLDVDGAERAVLAGAERTLRSPELASVMMEVLPEREDELQPLLDAGFGISERWDRGRPGRASYVLLTKTAAGKPAPIMAPR